jgi:hypothetical protein
MLNHGLNHGFFSFTFQCLFAASGREAILKCHAIKVWGRGIFRRAPKKSKFNGAKSGRKKTFFNRANPILIL